MSQRRDLGHPPLFQTSQRKRHSKICFNGAKTVPTNVQEILLDIADGVAEILSKAGFLLSAGNRLRIFHVSAQPAVHLPEHVENRLPRCIAVGLQGQQHKSHGATLAFDRTK
jgi:hypothetical protein